MHKVHEKVQARHASVIFPRGGERRRAKQWDRGGLLTEAVLHEVLEKVQAHDASVKSSKEEEKVEGPSNMIGGGGAD